MTSRTAFLKTNLFLLCAALCIWGCKQKETTGNNLATKDSVINIPVKNPYYVMDQSPMDMIYYPVNYSIQKMHNAQPDSGPIMRIIYSRPHRKGRNIFGKDSSFLCPYQKTWRLGANEATEIEFFKNVVLGGKNIAKGKYILYAIPFKDKWTLALNSNVFSWGLAIDSTQDILRTDVPTMAQEPEIEDFTMQFVNMGYGADLLIAWDKVKVILPIEFSQ